MQVDAYPHKVYSKRMDNSTSERYDRLYKENLYPFGEEHIFFVEKALQYLKSGEVLDLGAGDGRNSIYLAAQGFHVLAVDFSQVAIKKIKKISDSRNISLDIEVADIRKRKIVRSYDLILAAFVLHHLSRSEALTLIQNMMAHTSIHGLNIIATFTEQGDFYKNNPGTENFYIRNAELKTLYSKWEILRYEEREEEAFAKRGDGSPMRNICVYLLARRVA